MKPSKREVFADTDYSVVGTIVAHCPVCHKTHTIELREKESITPFRGKIIHYKKIYSYCENERGSYRDFMTLEQHQENQQRIEKRFDEECEKDKVKNKW